MALQGSKLAGGSPKNGRVKHDYYATPPYATHMFLDSWLKEGMQIKKILEPACGEGHISEVLKDRFLNSNVVSTDLIDRGYGVGGVDFLNYDFKGKYDLIITNPPFKHAQEFIEKSLDLTERYVVMFAKLQLLEGKKRYNMFLSTPLKEIYVHSGRVSTFRNGKEFDENGKKWSTTMAFAWFVWDKEYTGEPTIKWLK